MRFTTLTVVSVLILAFACNFAWAQPPTPLVIRLEDVKLVAVYPLEVKYGSWTRILLDLTALANMTVKEVRARVVLVTERGAFTLLDRRLLANVNLTQGQQLQWSLEFQASIPQPPPVEPFLELYITADYTTHQGRRVLEYKSPVTLVPQLTYEELYRAYAAAQAKAAQADQLQRELSVLQQRLAAETNKSSILSSVLQVLQAENAELRRRVELLVSENSALRANLSILGSELAKLRETAQRLLAERGDLESRLASLSGEHTRLRDQYTMVLSELGALRSSYERLLSESGLLKGILASLVVAAAFLTVYYFKRRRPSPPPLPPPPPPA